MANVKSNFLEDHDAEPNQGDYIENTQTGAIYVAHRVNPEMGPRSRLRYINLRDGGYRDHIDGPEYVKLPEGTKVEITV